MRLTIENKSKLEIFVSIFQLLKNWSSHINMNFEKDKLYIQSIDKSHICLADIEIKDKLLKVKDKLLNTNFEYENFNSQIGKIYNLKESID